MQAIIISSHRQDSLYMNPTFTVGAGAYAGCAFCTHSKILQKIVYPGNRRFLPPNDVQRTNCSSYPSQAVDANAPPEIKTMGYIDKANKEYEAASDAAEKKRFVQEKGCKGTYSLRHASSHNHILDTPVDPMHLVKDIVEHAVHLIVGKEDSVKVRKQEEECKRFSSAWMKAEQDTLPEVPFTLRSPLQMNVPGVYVCLLGLIGDLDLYLEKVVG